MVRGGRSSWGLVLALSLGCGGSDDTAADGGGTESGSGSASAGGSAISESTTGPETTGGGEPGVFAHGTIEIPLGLSSSCEHDGAERVLSERIKAIVPQRMYTAGCTDPSGVQRMFISLPVTTGHTRSHPVEVVDNNAALVFEVEMDESSGEFATTGNAVHRTECLDAHGITVASDCSTVATLCRRPHFTSQTESFTADLVAGFSDADTITQPGPIGGEPTEAHKDYNDEMWLYEWNGASLDEEPDKYVVHKGIGPLTRARGLGNYYLLNGESDDSYAYAVRASTGGNTRHVADSFLVVDRSGSEYAIAEGRGYTWACGRGHTTFQRPVYNPYTQQYAIWCVTDTNEDKIPGFVGFWFRTEAQGDDGDNQFMLVNGNADHRQGSPTVLQPLPNGNFLGVLVGHPDDVEDWQLWAATKIGLAEFDGTSGRLVRDIKWIVSDSDHYLGHAQLGIIGEDRFLLGYARLYELDGPTDNGRNQPAFQIPTQYYTLEIDSQGNALTEITELDGVGWGDQDQWTHLGDGQIAWAYVPEPVLKADGGVPGCSFETLQLSSYRVAP